MYKTRKIQFKEIVECNDWKIKVYTIAKFGEFNHPVFYQNVLNKLPEWLKMENSFDSSFGNRRHFFSDELVGGNKHAKYEHFYNST